MGLREPPLTAKMKAPTLLAVARHRLRCLNRIPERLIDDRWVFAPMGLAVVNNLAEIDAVLQYQVEPTAREWLAADAAIRSARPGSGYDPRTSSSCFNNRTEPSSV